MSVQTLPELTSFPPFEEVHFVLRRFHCRRVHCPHSATGARAVLLLSVRRHEGHEEVRGERRPGCWRRSLHGMERTLLASWSPCVASCCFLSSFFSSLPIQSVVLSGARRVHVLRAAAVSFSWFFADGETRDRKTALDTLVFPVVRCNCGLSRQVMSLPPGCPLGRCVSTMPPRT